MRPWLLLGLGVALMVGAPVAGATTSGQSGQTDARNPTPRQLFNALGGAAPVQQSQLPDAFSYPLTQNAGSAPAGFVGEVDTSVLPVGLNTQLSDLLAIDVAANTKAAVEYVSRNGLVVQSDGVTAIAAPAPVPHHLGLFHGAAAAIVGEALIRTSTVATTRAAARTASVLLLRGGIGYFRSFEHTSGLASAAEVRLRSRPVA